MSATSKVEVFEGADGDWYWRHIESTDVVSTSGEGYTHRPYAIERARIEADAHGSELWVDGKLRDRS